ncbi:lycopene beta-cyclase [Friedmanniella endophytica]|uniref:Lycopene beta-cyclase n=1 Tax=Microlunatus kandeliicorticis TaxID=1759536 RepID=A0A7W3P616_9ACTN|nr:lycopene cyclase family protein [Microlunatus kandeliicorticis]MBA8794519.1 lycopene beta-cyclase [Microlunatus kandeliicorticis]
MTRHAQVVVLGLGPAGRSVAHRLATVGVPVVAVDPNPDRRWTPTYAAWEDELPDWLPPQVVATRTPRPHAWAGREHVLDRAYVVLDTVGLQKTLDVRAVDVVTATALRADAHTVELNTGETLTADLVLDARGSRPSTERAAQTAYGLVLPDERAAAASGPWFMDWRADHGAGDGAPPSFLYAVPLGEGRTLLEETCLVGRPALGLGELQRRLERRLAARGVSLDGTERVERVRFSVEPDPEAARPAREAPTDRPVPLGARAGLMHPATGYSVALGLRLADELAGAVAAGRDVWSVLWPARARQVQRLREIGLTTLLRLPHAGVEQFFAAFFALPLDRQRAYLSERTDPAGTLAAMARMARTLPPGLTAVAVGSALPRLPGRLRS